MGSRRQGSEMGSHSRQPPENRMPALDINMIESLSRELHPPHTNLMAETEVCPWTLFLTMSLTLLKGLMPHVPQMLPFLITDPEMRSRAEETFFDYFMGGAGAALADGFGNSLESSDNTPRSGLAIGGIDVVQVLDFMRTLYSLTK